MAKITWLGEDAAHTNADGSGTGPRFTTAYGNRRFEKGKPVTVTDKAIIASAQKNQFFEVELTDDDQDDAETADAAPVRRGPGRPKAVKADDGDKDKG